MINRIIIKKGNLYGAMNKFGEIVIEPIYENMNKFSNGLAAVCKGNKWGYIDQDGNQIIDFLYHSAKDFSIHGLGAVKLSEESASWSLVKKTGELIATENKNQYYHIDEFNSEGYAIVSINGGYNIIDTQGKHIDNEIYYSLKYIEEQNIFIANRLGKACFIDVEGQVLVDIEEEYDEIYYPSNGLCDVSRDGKFGYIDEKGKLAIPLQYEEAYEFADNGLAFVVCENGLGGYINKENEFVIKPIFESGSMFKFGLAAVSKQGRYIFIDENGNKFTDHRFKYLGGFSECGLAKFELDGGSQGFITCYGDIVLIKKGCQVEEFMDNKSITKIKVNDKVALIDSKGNPITGLNYDEIIISPDSDLNPFLRNGLWGYLDHEGNEVIANKYLAASEFTKDNLALVEEYDPTEDKVKRLYINGEDRIVDNRLIESFEQSFSDKYLKVYRFRNGLALAVKKEITRILDACGKEIPMKSFDIQVKNDNLMLDIEEEKPYEYDLSSNVIYEIIISFKTQLGREEISELIEGHFHEDDILEYSILEAERPLARVLWKMQSWADPADIEVAMYYLLDNRSLGEYDYHRIDRDY